MTTDTIAARPVVPLDAVDKRGPMPAAPIVYNEDSSIAWERMWGIYCVLASAGGPPHRGTRLEAQLDADLNSEGYRTAVAEIVRGIRLVSGLSAQAAETGWIAVECGQASKARWLCEQIVQENVASFHRGTRLFVPVGEHFTLRGEIKNVITVVAKTTHYWTEHLCADAKSTLLWEEALKDFGVRIRRWLSR